MDRSVSIALDEMAARLNSLQERCDQLAADNATLRAALATPVPNSPDPGATPSSALPVTPVAPIGRSRDHEVSRRGVLRKAATAAAVTVVGAAVLTERGARPAAAANGSAVTAGAVTTGEARTSVRYDGGAGFGGVVLLGNDSTYDGNGADYPAGIGGWAGAGSTAGAGGVANGVYGFTDNGGGNGVVGLNSNLVAGAGAGVLGLAFGATAAGVRAQNTLGTAVDAESASTAAGATAINGVISSTSPGGFSAALRGQNNGTGGLGIGVWGSHAGSGWGAYATSVSGIGLNANGGSGTGVDATGAVGMNATGTTTGLFVVGGTTGVAASAPTALSATGTGSAGVAVNASADSTAAAATIVNTGKGEVIHATSGAGSGLGGTAAAVIDAASGIALMAQSAGGRGAVFKGSAAQVRLVAGKLATHPTNGQAGDLYVDKTGRLWYCKVAGPPSTWVKLA